MNFIEPPPEQAGAPAEGKGVVHIGTGAGESRTAIPSMVFDHFECLFSKGGGAAELREPLREEGGDVVFELDPGDWAVTVRAFAEAGEETLAAEGSETFTVTPGKETSVLVRVYPVVGEGAGVLNYTLRYPGAATVEFFTLTLLSDDSDRDLTLGAVTEGTDTKTLTGKVQAGSGYYLARTSLKKDGITVGRTEVVHIYKDLSTELELEFVDGDFKALVVVSAADSGPGSLREALTSSMAGDVEGVTILIDLPADDRVITLKSALPGITKSLTIRGNGATLTQDGSVVGPLLGIGYGNAEVHISRLHFKGGRSGTLGAGLQSLGKKLTVESCIFSENRITGLGGGGSAITTKTLQQEYSSKTLIVSGCTFYGNIIRAGSTTFDGAIYIGEDTNLVLTGNVFWENTRGTVSNPVSGDGIITSGGFNVSDRASGTGSGWAFESADRQAVFLPVSPVNFKSVSGSAAADVITAKPADYPAVDFYGVPIPETGAAAGAVQTQAQGYFLDYYAPLGPGKVVSSGPPPNADGLTAAGTITLTAVPDDGKDFRYWIVDGARYPEQTPPGNLTLNITASTKVQAVFATTWEVNNADSGPGSLREALNALTDLDKIVLPAGETITLSSPLPIIGKNIVIEGNGATVIASGIFGPTFKLSGSGAQVRMSRIHFKGFSGGQGGGALMVWNSGALTVESCIFSDNRSGDNVVGGSGGAIFGGRVTVLGCTFYENRTNNSGRTKGTGGAIHGSATLIGNVFWGNTAGSNNVASGGVISGGFNVSDKASGTDSASGSGWTFESTDRQAVSLPVSPVYFKPVSGGAAAGVITAKPADYPAVDFYGVPIPETGAAAGAVQTLAEGSGYVLDYGPQGPGKVTVSGATVDGITSGSVTLTPVPDDGKDFRYWIVDGARYPEQTPPGNLTLNITASTKVRAVFATIWKVNNADSGPGSLREALNALADGDKIVFPAGQTITLSSPLPRIEKSIVIEGNGATLTQNGSLPYIQLLYPYGQNTEVSISRLHFKGGRTDSYGGAIRADVGNLTLESCIFSDNTTTGNGGAILTYNRMTVKGCTFINNRAENIIRAEGGAIDGPVTLIGNIFQKNTATTFPVIDGRDLAIYGSGFVTVTGGFNVSDYPSATGKNPGGGSGWIFAGTDKQLTDINFDSDFRPSPAGLPVISPLPDEFPALYFDGSSRGPSSAPGAMPAQTGG
jgi:hypothetical protein